LIVTVPKQLLISGEGIAVRITSGSHAGAELLAENFVERFHRRFPTTPTKSSKRGEGMALPSAREGVEGSGTRTLESVSRHLLLFVFSFFFRVRLVRIIRPPSVYGNFCRVFAFGA